MRDEIGGAAATRNGDCDRRRERAEISAKDGTFGHKCPQTKEAVSLAVILVIGV
jgi:hypothetical protein